jgi:hypothetical protein
VSGASGAGSAEAAGLAGAQARALGTRADPVAAAPVLGEEGRRILALESRWTTHRGAKGDAIRAEFGVSSARYYQLLNAVIDSPAAIAVDPLLVTRLRRLRDVRAATRLAGSTLMRTDSHGGGSRGTDARGTDGCGTDVRGLGPR